MRPTNDIEKLVKKLCYKPSVQTHSRILTNLLLALESGEKPAVPQMNFWRIIMKSKIAQLATAAAVIIIAAIGISLLQNSVTPAYAIEQTVEACKDLRRLYFEYFGSSDNKMKEAWLEYDDSGQIKNVRVNFYKSSGEDDSVIVWKQGRTQQWLKRTKRLRLHEDKIFTDKIHFFVQSYDPSKAVENIQKMEKEGKVEIDIEEPTDKTAPIVLTVVYEPNTYLLEGPMPQMKEIFFIDQSTKLVKAIEIYELKDGRYLDRGVWKYPEYDIAFDDNIFNLEDEIPSDVRVVDMMALDIGLEQGDLTNERVAIKLVREFFKALIAKDYTEAIKLLYHENPKEEAEIQKKLEKINVLRIISIDKTFPPPPNISRGFLGVSCILEIEKDGQIMRWEPNDIFVGHLLGHPSRWTIGSFKHP
jgi:hypothetical protein